MVEEMMYKNNFKSKNILNHPSYKKDEDKNM